MEEVLATPGGALLQVRSAGSKKALDGNIFVHIRPVDAQAAADEFPLVAGAGGCFLQTREEVERNRKLAPIGKRDAEASRREAHTDRNGLELIR